MDVREKTASEKRLIDANAMRADWLENGENEYVYDTNAVLDSIDSQPTIDAVEVVRKPIKGYEGYYEVDQFGHVFRLERIINHKDEDKTNNFVENLEWCTAQYNNTYGNKAKRQADKIRGIPHTDEHKKKISSSLLKYYETHDSASIGRISEKRKGVVGVRNGESVQFQSVTEAAIAVNGSRANITRSCNSKTRKAYGYKWTWPENRKGVLTMTEYIENPLSGKLRGVTYEDGKIIDVHIRDTDDVVKVFVPVRHGRWKAYSDCGVTRSSVCDWIIEECIDYKFCPNCGSRMDGGDD